MKHIAPVVAALIIVATGCSSSGPKGPFVPTGKKIIFSEIIDSKATTLVLSQKNRNTMSLKPIVELLNAAKSLEKPSVVQSKILKASQPTNLVNGIGAGFKEVLLGLGATETKESRMDPSQFVAETTLLYAELHEAPDNIFVIVEAEAVIKNRMSGDTEWSEKMKDKIVVLPLENGKRKINANVKDIAELLSKSDFEIREAVLATTAELGKALGQKVRNVSTKWDVAPGR